MSHSTSIPSPESIEYTPEELWEYAERAWEANSGAAQLILIALHDELRQNGLFHFAGLMDIASGYGWCASKIWHAAVYLAERGVIELECDDDSEAEDVCRCYSCRCQRYTAKLPFRVDADVRGLQHEKHAVVCNEYLAAQKPVERIAQNRGYVYLMRCGDRYKIGITTDVDRRIKQLCGQQPPFPIELIHSIASSRRSEAERALHERFSESRAHGEWFSLTDEMVENVIRSMNEWRDDPGATGEGADD